MLIQNASNIAQFQQHAKFAAQSEFKAPASNTKAVTNASVELANVAHGQAAEQQPSTPQLKNAVDGINLENAVAPIQTSRKSGRLWNRQL